MFYPYEGSILPLNYRPDIFLMRLGGIEPTTPLWKSGIMPLNYKRRSTEAEVLFRINSIKHRAVGSRLTDLKRIRRRDSKLLINFITLYINSRESELLSQAVCTAPTRSLKVAVVYHAPIKDSRSGFRAIELGFSTYPISA